MEKISRMSLLGRAFKHFGKHTLHRGTDSRHIWEIKKLSKVEKRYSQHLALDFKIISSAASREE
jgi:hypothetical protein